jgi:hypothetical protein
MKSTPMPGNLPALLLLAFALCAPAVWGQQEGAAAPAIETPAAETHSSAQERDYQNAIAETESSEGAYAAGLSESLYSLALSLQSQGRHEEAIKLFRRGVHLARINEGLYCPQQIPLLQGEIASYKAEQNYALADERQHYLYRVQMRSLKPGDEFTDALMQQAQWQYDAYQLGLGPEGYSHLMDMWDLYQQAVQDVIAREGEKSPKLLPPLYGMLQAQYLISGYELRETDQQQVFAEDQRINEPLLRFRVYRSDSYQQGNAVIKAISGVDQGPATPGSKALAQTLVMLGDWRLWNGRTDDAWEAYREAETELAQAGDAQAQIQQLFGEPVALPDFTAIKPLPPTVDPQQGDVTFAFGVGENGRVQDVERMDNNEAEDRQASLLMRQLRRTTFRPRFTGGQPVETEKLVKAFDVK